MMDGWPLYIFGIKRALVRDECPKEFAWRDIHGRDILGAFIWADLGNGLIGVCVYDWGVRVALCE